MYKHFVTFLAASLISLPIAAETTTTDHAKKTNTSAKDAEIIMIVTTLNDNEINSGKLAADKATNEKVKDFANQIVKDHSANKDEVIKIGEQTGIGSTNSQKAKTLEQQGKAEVKKLSDTNTTNFDAAYLNSQIKDHKNALIIIKVLAKKANNPELKNHLTKTQEAINQHLKDANELQKNIKS